MESQAAASLMRTGGLEVSRVDLRGLEGAGPRTNRRSIENVIASLDKSSFTAMQAIEPGSKMFLLRDTEDLYSRHLYIVLYNGT